MEDIITINLIRTFN